MNPELTLLYVHGTSIGYGRMGVKLAAALDQAGVAVYDDQGPGPAEFAHSEIKRVDLEDHGYTDHSSKDTNVVCWASVPTHARWWKEGQHAAMLTMWEAMSLPESFRETMHEFDTIIVPSDHNVELFSKFHPNVRKVQLGIDPAEWHYLERPEPTSRFNFLIGGSGPRKGTDLAHAAFRKVFGDGEWTDDGPEPWLIMKNPKGEESYERGGTTRQFEGPRVETVRGRLTDAQEIDLYARANCYLQPSRGEGFGLQPLQAIAQGIPTILTDAHGQAGFAYLGYALEAKPEPASYFIYGDAGDWWEPNFDQLCDRMRWVYDNWHEAEAAAKVDAKIAARDWTWDETARQFIAAFDGELELPFAGTQHFHIPQPHLYETVLLRDWTADIGGTMYQFKRGESYHEPADVKRVLFEAGLLDPSCLRDDDLGLAPEQAGRIADYTASHAACHTCGQTLNTDDRQAAHADELGAWKDAVYALLKHRDTLPDAVKAVLG